MTRFLHDTQDGMIVHDTPVRRRRTARSRLLAVVIIAVMAASAGVLEEFRVKASGPMAQAGPSSYFPR